MHETRQKMQGLFRKGTRSSILAPKQNTLPITLRCLLTRLHLTHSFAPATHALSSDTQNFMSFKQSLLGTQITAWVYFYPISMGHHVRVWFTSLDETGDDCVIISHLGSTSPVASGSGSPLPPPVDGSHDVIKKFTISYSTLGKFEQRLILDYCIIIRTNSIAKNSKID
jgi:hypothetical protein